MNQIITTKLREDALILRRLSTSSPTILSSAKEKMLREIHRILTLMLGTPPSPTSEFTWEFHDKDDKFTSVTATPVNFAKELSTPDAVAANNGSDVRQLFSLVNDPRNKYMELLTVDRLGNIFGMRGITYVNVPMEVMKKACIGMLRADLPIFFGSDVGKFSASSSGIMDTGLIDYENGFNIKLGLTKAERLQTEESAMTHAMVLTAVHVVGEKEEEKSVRWRVQNSWGDKAGSEGWFVMSDAWMDQFCYQAVVDPSFVEESVRKVLEKKPKVLPLWDPMGALARN
jgi:bleomycin hydrolase